MEARWNDEGRRLKPAPLPPSLLVATKAANLHVRRGRALEDAGNLAGHNGKCKREGECMPAGSQGVGTHSTLSRVALGAV